MAAATVSGDSAMSNNPASRPDPTRMHSFRAVNSEGENGASSRQDDRASAVPQTQPQPPAQGAARNSDTPHGSRPPDRRLYDAAPATSQSYSSSPPAKRKRIEEPASLVVRTSADSSDAPIVIKTSPETQAREVIHLLSPERTSPVALEASTSQYPGGRDSTSRTNEGSSWHSEQRRSETASSASRPPFNAYPNAQDGNQSSVHQIDDSSDEDDSDAPVGGRHSDGRRPKRQFSHRTKTGCFTCRRRKKKCDEGKPACQNCIKGKFQCWGYGNKPVGDMTTLRTTHPGIFPNTIRQPPEWPPPGRVPVNPDQPWHGPPHPPYMPEQQQNHYGAPPQQPPPPPNAYGPPQHDARDPWARPHNDAAHIHLQGNKLGPVDYAAPLNIREYQPKDQPPPPHRPQPPPDPYMPHLHRGPPPPPPPPPQYGHHFGGREGSHMSAGRRSSHLPPMVENERDKMLIGLPYRHWKDGKLIADRLDCKTAVDLYNRAALPSEALSQDERANRFTAILNPGKRISAHGDAASIGRIGRCGERTIVEAPFYCDYGYNLIIGSETVIYPNCFIQDPCEIIIGNRCIVGPNVKLYGMTASIDVKNRSGSQGNFLGGSIQIEDDCWIGGDVTILPYRIIGKGATVAAGSVVTRNVKPFTIVAGNPAKEVRSLDDSTIDRRMRTDIQQENEHMIEEMKRRRYLTGSEGPPGQQGRPM